MQKRRPILSALFALVLSAIVLALTPLNVRAAEVIYSGTWGTCPWEITNDGVLTVHPGVGGESCSSEDWPPRSYWIDYSGDITSVVFAEEGGEKVVAPEDSTALLAGLDNVVSVDASGLDTSSVWSMQYLFDGCSALTSLDSSEWDTSSVWDMSMLFSYCTSLEALDVSGWDTSSVGDMSSMFFGCSSLKSLDVSTWDTSNVAYMDAMFCNCSSLASVDVSRLNTSHVLNFTSMFHSCCSLELVDVSGWNTSRATDMSFMFGNCDSLASLDVSGWDTSSVTDMNYMFAGCPFESLDVSRWDTSNVSDMYAMFQGCYYLASLDVSGWETSDVTDMSYMFCNCSSLASLDVSGWDTSSATDMGGMFNYCSSLIMLDVSGWDTSSVANMGFMFNECTNLATIYVGGGWTTATATCSDSMFLGCTALVGGNGTAYDANHVDAEYARIDAPSTPGYLTGAQASNDLANATVTVTDQTYDGTAQRPPVTVRLGGRTLVSGTDYTVSYRNNINAGAATVTVTGKGGYTGTKTATFAIACADISSATVTAIPDQAYTGSPVTPKPTVKLGSHALSEGTDYELSYTGNTEIGTATVTITGKGNLTGTKTATFEIVPKGEPPEPPAAPYFLDADPSDDGNHGAEVDWMGRSGISTGYPAAGGREYRGLLQVARCDFAAFLYRMADLADDGARNDSIRLTDDEVESVLSNVADCTPATDHAPEVAWLIESGISRGWPNADGTLSFRPYATVARQDMAAFLYRYVEYKTGSAPAPGPEQVRFSDVRHGDDANHAAEVEWLASVGVTRGWQMKDGTYEFRGTSIVARQDMAAFMYRLYAYLQGRRTSS